jgi:type IV pilus assembly protein PilE
MGISLNKPPVAKSRPNSGLTRMIINDKIHGFTLIELMVVVAVTAVLAAIAIPSYGRYAREARRSEAITTLLGAQKTYEQYFSQNSTYPPNNTLPPSGSGTFPSTTYYNYTASNSTSFYTITATAKSGTSQTSDREGTASCSTMSINYMNERTPQNCWFNN